MPGAPVPEPGTIALVGLGMVGLAIYGKRRQNNKA
ncbi:PEP-CTERM sorting domain-containing protein [Geobacter sp. FeAm09]|nr:PEP-CTERM sorting domain-containing protein [Geobacter sp. FeAm09]